MRNVSLVLLSVCLVFVSSCQNDQVESIVKEAPKSELNHSVVKNDQNLQRSIIDYLSPLTKMQGQSTLDISKFDLSQIHIAHASDKSFKTLSVFNGEDYSDQAVFIMKGDEIVTAFTVKLNPLNNSKMSEFICSNDMNEPIMSGIYKGETPVPALMVNQVYNNPLGTLSTKASVNTWGCNLTVLAVGTFMSFSFGMVTAGAGVAVGVAYSLAGMAMCDNLE